MVNHYAKSSMITREPRSFLIIIIIVMRCLNEPPAEIVVNLSNIKNVNKMIDCYHTEELLHKRTKLKRASKGAA